MFGRSAWWAGVDVYRQNGGGGFDYVTTVETPTTMGVLTSPLYPGPVDRWDRGNALSVRFFSAAGLLSVTDAQVLAGANALGVLNPASGQWEVVQFATASLTGTNSYTLTRLLRGQLGTEAAMGTGAVPIPAGATVVVLDPDLTVLDESVDNRSLTQTLRVGPGTAAVGDATFAEVTLRFDGVGLRPWSPSQIAGRRDAASGDVAVSWVRRTRFAGDSWDPDSVPLNEDSEAYVLNVLRPDGSVARAVTGLGAPAWTYPAADQTADFGALQAAYTFSIAQVSALFGPGQAATRTVYLRATAPTCSCPISTPTRTRRPSPTMPR